MEIAYNLRVATIQQNEIHVTIKNGIEILLKSSLRSVIDFNRFKVKIQEYLIIYEISGFFQVKIQE